jgi:uncharacterized RDD family membrane protein YckC
MSTTPSSKKIVFSPVGNRIAAIFIDSLILLIPAYLITAVLPDSWGDVQGFKNSAAMSLFFIYNPIMESLGGTFGKKFVKSYAINLRKNAPPSYLTSFARFIISVLPIMVLGYGSAAENPAVTLTGMALLVLTVVPIFYSKRKQTLYDFMTNVVVIEFEQTENQDVTTPDDKNDYTDRLENRSSAFPSDT